MLVSISPAAAAWLWRISQAQSPEGLFVDPGNGCILNLKEAKLITLRHLQSGSRISARSSGKLRDHQARARITDKGSLFLAQQANVIGTPGDNLSTK